jgi:antitoxin FitA
MNPKRSYYGGNSVPNNVSVKNVPDEIMEKLRQRAKHNHRSLQGELMTILEEAAGSAPFSVDQAESKLRALDLATGNESTSWIRELRDGR